MFTKFHTLIFAAITTAARAFPSAPQPALVPSDIAVPLSNITIVGPHPEGAQVNPTMLFCPSANCAGGCLGETIVDRNFETCQTALPPTFLSVMITNPDATFIPYTIWVSFTPNTCPTGIEQIPQTNVCFNLTPAGNGWVRRNTGGGTF